MPCTIASTPDGPRLEVAREVDAAPEAAWDLLATPDRWPEWGPSVRAVDCADDRIAPGSSGRVRLPGGARLPFRIEEATPPDGGAGRWTWRVAGIPATGHRVEPLAGGCRVVFEVPLPAAPYAPVCRRALDRIERALS